MKLKFTLTSYKLAHPAELPVTFWHFVRPQKPKILEASALIATTALWDLPVRFLTMHAINSPIPKGAFSQLSMICLTVTMPFHEQRPLFFKADWSQRSI